MPTKRTLVHTLQTPGLKDNMKPRDFTIKTHERVIQVKTVLYTRSVSQPSGTHLTLDDEKQYSYRSILTMDMSVTTRGFEPTL